jgi:hypothetical protein
MVGSLGRSRWYRLLTLVAIFGVLVGTVSAPISPVAAQEDLSIRGEPDLSVTAPATTLAPGQTTELTLQVTNDGELDWGSPDQRAAVVTARDVKVEPSADDAAFDVDSNVIALGAVGEERPRDVNVAVTVPDDAEPGTYDLEVDVSYSHVSQYWTSGTTQYSQDHSHTIEETIEIDVEDTARFELSNVTTDAQIGNDGEFNATLENVGSERAEDVRLVLESSSSAIAFGGTPATELYVGSLDPGETAQVRTDVSVIPGASVRDYSIGGSVTYADADGFQRKDPDLAVGVRPISEQTFSIENTSGDLRAGEERQISVTIRNDGPRAVTDPVVAVGFENPNVYLDSPQQAIENLDGNETATLTYAVDVSAVVQESQQGVTVTVAYTDSDGDRRRSDAMATDAHIDPERDQFDVAVVNGSITAGSTDTVELNVTNRGDRPLSEIEVKAYLDDPLDSNDDAAMIDSLEPGESSTISFDVSAAGTAPSKTYALSTDFHYERPDGDAELSRTYAIPIHVQPQQETELPLELIGVAGALLVLIVLLWQRDRIRELFQ